MLFLMSVFAANKNPPKRVLMISRSEMNMEDRDQGVSSGLYGIRSYT